jgi:hypothetical protein
MKNLKLNPGADAVAVGVGMAPPARGNEPALPGSGPQPRREDLPPSTATDPSPLDDADAAETQRNRLETEEAGADAQAKAKNKAQEDRIAREEQQAKELVQLTADEKTARVAGLLRFPWYQQKWLDAVAEADTCAKLADAAATRAATARTTAEFSADIRERAAAEAEATFAGREYHLYRLGEAEAKARRERLEAFPRV